MTDRAPDEPSDPVTAPDVTADSGSPVAAPDAAPPAPGAHHARRRFFRQFAGEIVQSAATVAGMAGALQRQSMDAANSILSGSGLESLATGATLGGDGSPAPILSGTAPADPASGVAAGFRTAFRWDDQGIHLVDQRRLPAELVEMRCQTGGEVAWAIREMVVRGAPAMGQAAAIGVALTAQGIAHSTPFVRRAAIRGTGTALINARPTAANVRWAVERCFAAMEAVGDIDAEGQVIADAIRAEAEAIVGEAAEDHERLATLALAELPTPEDRPLQLLTHCNTGPLACGQFGTALGVVQVAVHQGRQVHVFVDETRPYLQGARLTAWELAQAGVGHTLIADSAAGWVFTKYSVDAVLVGADRIAANGDTANKIGTYPLAVMARRHHIPFYVCAPLGSFDPATPDGSAIMIELRSGEEVTSFRGTVIAPVSTPALNPAFDVTPHDLITGIVTEAGVFRAPFGEQLSEAFAAAAAARAQGTADRAATLVAIATARAAEIAAEIAAASEASAGEAPAVATASDLPA